MYVFLSTASSKAEKFIIRQMTADGRVASGRLSGGESGPPQGLPGGSHGKESTCNAGDLGLIPGLGRSPGGGHGTHSSILA